MGLYDRDYAREKFQQLHGYAPQMRMTGPHLTPVVKWLLIINISVFLAGLIKPFGILIDRWFCYDPSSLTRVLQLWRLITYQFLHSHASVWHIVYNMLGLFFLGPVLERHWASKRFLIFYLSCGVVAALFYLTLVAVRFLLPLPMIGASGAILGMLAACAILFPHFVVFIIIFPVPIRVAAVAFTIIYLVTVITRGANAGGHAAHLAGMAAGVIYVLSQPWRTRFKLKVLAVRWEKQMARQRRLQAELDRILKKVHGSGIHNLSAKEKKTLKKATEIEQKRSPR